MKAWLTLCRIGGQDGSGGFHTTGQGWAALATPRGTAHGGILSADWLWSLMSEADRRLLTTLLFAQMARKRRRMLINRSRPDDLTDGATGDCSGRVLIPAYRIQMIKEV